jgi:DNA-binding response OmpR family regulator
MYKVALLSTRSVDLSAFKEILQKDFEVTHVSNENSLLLLIQSWQPHVLICGDNRLNDQSLSKTLPFLNRLRISLICLASQYDLRQELLAFQLGADHYLLTSTPIVSLKVRIESVISKSLLRAKLSQRLDSPSDALRTQEPSLTPNPSWAHDSSLPQRTSQHKFGAIQVFAEQNMLKYKESIYRITHTQMKILMTLLEHVGELVTREWMLKNVFENERLSARSIDAHVAKLKRSVPPLRSYISNIYGKGYLLNERIKEAA